MEKVLHYKKTDLRLETKCSYLNDGTCIGSIACQECKHHIAHKRWGENYRNPYVICNH